MNDSVFFASVRQHLFGGSLAQSQVEGLNIILKGWDTYGDGDIRKEAYILATTKRETGSTEQPIEEWGKGMGHSYGLPTGPWHNVYDGRGFVQETFEANYVAATRKLHTRGLFLDVNLDKSPELAMRPDIAVAILVIGMMEGWFTGHKLSDYISAARCDFYRARQIVNSMDHASDIATYANAFLAALRAAQ